MKESSARTKCERYARQGTSPGTKSCWNCFMFQEYGCRNYAVCGGRIFKKRSEGEQITVFGKGGKTRSIILPISTWSSLISHCGDTRADAPSIQESKGRQTGPLTGFRIVQATAGPGRASPKNVSCHWFRHAHASHALDNGGFRSTLYKSICGHSSVAKVRASTFFLALGLVVEIPGGVDFTE